jgi:hypothetical protein
MDNLCDAVFLLYLCQLTFKSVSLKVVLAILYTSISPELLYYTHLLNKLYLTLILHFDLAHFANLNLVSHLLKSFLASSHNAHSLFVLNNKLKFQLTLLVNQLLFLRE